jgi:hypothetical protein
MKGREIEPLLDCEVTEGFHENHWDATNLSGVVYFIN